MASADRPIAIIGAGRVGGALAALWFRAGLNVSAIHSRTVKSARAASRFAARQRRGKRVKAPRVFKDRGDAARSARWIVLAVPDDDLAQLVDLLARDENIRWKGKVVLHTSGFHSSEVLSRLADEGAHIGTLHPLQSVPSSAEGFRRIPGSAFAVEGVARAETAGRTLARAAGGRAMTVPKQGRPLYHAAAALASNALVALLDASLEAMVAAGVSPKQALKALVPLVRGTVDNVEALSTVKALTGPVKRGDVGTVVGHLDELERLPSPGGRVESGAAEIYTVLSRRALGVAKRGAGATNSHHRLAKLLIEQSRKYK